MYGFVLNIEASLTTAQQTLPQQGLAATPNIAFSWLQVVTNGVMVVLISYALLILVRLNQYVLRDKFWSVTPRRFFALCIILAFSLPSWWQWTWAIVDEVQGQHVIDGQNKGYLITAILMPYPAALCLWRLWHKRWRRPAAPSLAPVKENPVVTNTTLSTDAWH